MSSSTYALRVQSEPKLIDVTGFDLQATPSDLRLTTFKSDSLMSPARQTVKPSPLLTNLLPAYPHDGLASI